MSTMDSQLTQRNGSLPDLVRLLREQHTAKLDVVIPSAGVRSAGGRWRIEGTGAAVLGPDGVTTNPGTLVPTGTCDAGMADKLGIPVGYLRRLREEHLGLYDANVNGWLEHQPGRRLLIRTLRGDAAGGIARAVLSERYRFVDNLDVLLAVLDGIRSAGADVEVRRCDLTERRMYVQIASQSVAAHADVLLRDYVSPFTGARGADNPLVFAGFVLSNSETGHGSFSITPRLIARPDRLVWTLRPAASRWCQCAGRCRGPAADEHVDGPDVLDLPPGRGPAAGLVSRGRAFGDDAFQALLGGCGQDVGAAADPGRWGLPGRPGRVEFVEPGPALHVGLGEQRLAVAVQQVEDHVHDRVAADQAADLGLVDGMHPVLQAPERRPAPGVQGHQLAVQHDRLASQ